MVTDFVKTAPTEQLERPITNGKGCILFSFCDSVLLKKTSPMESYLTRKRSLTWKNKLRGKKNSHFVAENELVRSRKQVASVRPLMENSFQTTKYKNIRSAWTPILHSEFNSKVRREI